MFSHLTISISQSMDGEYMELPDVVSIECMNFTKEIHMYAYCKADDSFRRLWNEMLSTTGNNTAWCKITAHYEDRESECIVNNKVWLKPHVYWLTDSCGDERYMATLHIVS